jgi:hypothetical protein
MKRTYLSVPRSLGFLNHVSHFAAMAAVVLLLQGCAERKPRAFVWSTATAVKPRIPAPAPGYKPPAIDESAPDLEMEIPPPAPRLTMLKSPPKPQVVVRTPPESSVVAKPEEPLLAPQLSQTEIAAAQQQMDESVGVAERNLAAAKGHRLNAAQSDLASKVNTFLDESKTAAREHDWTRAKNLAKKAQVLSEELAQSL